MRRALERQVRHLGLTYCVALRGTVGQEIVRAAMQQASLLVFSGRTARDGDRDGLPNVLLEAAALGTPIVAARAGCVEEFSDDALWLCDAGNPAALAETMRRALSENAYAKEKACAARRIIEQRFARDIAIAPLAQALEQTLT
jgi:glycosyltransferase involved in cell wall biosynthesis